METRIDKQFLAQLEALLSDKTLMKKIMIYIRHRFLSRFQLKTIIKKYNERFTLSLKINLIMLTEIRNNFFNLLILEKDQIL